MASVDFNDVAKAIQGSGTYLSLNGDFYLYKNGVYLPIPKLFIRSLIKKKLGSHSNIRNIDEVFTALSLDTNQPLEDINLFGPNVLNGMLDLDTLTLLPHDPCLLSTIQFPVNFNPEARCPLFIAAINEWLEDETKINLLQEFMGYCFTIGTTYEKALFMLGSGANGKSTFLHVIQAIVGQNNCSAIPLHKFSDRFSLAGLLGKNLNISSEAATKSALSDDVFKEVVSGDLIQAEKKNRDPFFFKPHAKLIIACNEIPRTEDRSDAVYRRMLILLFSRTFPERMQDRSLKDKLIAEKDGIFYWSLQGLKRLQQRGYFEEPAESRTERENYRRDNNTVLAYVAECCGLEAEAKVSKEEFYGGYKAWCDSNGINPASVIPKSKIGQIIKKLGAIGEGFIGPADHRVRAWTGLKVRE